MNYLISNEKWENISQELLARGLSALFTGAAYIIGDDVVNYIAEVLCPTEEGTKYGFIKEGDTIIGIQSSCPFFSISDKDVRVTKTRTYKWRTTSNRWTELTPETYLKNYFY
jgi:hypothetical protein